MTDSAKTSKTDRAPLGARRSSFEGPNKLSLGDLPAPSFSAVAAGQRSVPALEQHTGILVDGSRTPLTPGAAGPLGLDKQPWSLFGGDASGMPANKDNWASRVKSTTWNEDTAGPVGEAQADVKHQPSLSAGGLARSSSYSGDINQRRPAPDSPQEGHTSGLKRSGSQNERNPSTLSDLAPADDPAVLANQAGRFGSPTKPNGNSPINTFNGVDELVSPVQRNGSSRVTSGDSRAESPEYDLAAGMRNMRVNETNGSAANLQSSSAAASPWPQGPLKSNNVFGAPDQLYSAFYNGPSLVQTPSNVGSGLPDFAQPAYGNTNSYGRRDSGFASTPAVQDLYSMASSLQQPGNAGLRRAQAAWPGEEDQGRNAARNPSYGFGGMGRSPSQQFNAQMGGDALFYSGNGAQNQFYSPNMYGNNLNRGFGGNDDFGAYPYSSGLVGGDPRNVSNFNDPYGGMVGGMRYEDRMRGYRSPLLEEFRANRHRRWDLTDIRSHIVEFSSDQLGSRHLQTKLDSASFEERQMFFDEILPNIMQLSTDLFSNYVVQKAFEIADHSQKLALVKAMEGHILQLSLQMYGCRVIQKAIEHVFVDEQVAIVKEIERDVLKCARDQNANHVLQRILERVPADRIRSIPEACEGQVYALATHPYGCRVLQRILENLSEVRPLIEELLKYTQNLMQDQYSNYVIQHLLERGTKADRSAIISHVRGQLVPLSRHKFASNVIDKVILCADEEERRMLTDEILFDPTAVTIMLKDQFANYCLQKFMLVVQGPQREPLISRVADSLLNIRKYSGTVSKHLMAIEKFISNERNMNQHGLQHPIPAAYTVG